MKLQLFIYLFILTFLLSIVDEGSHFLMSFNASRLLSCHLSHIFMFLSVLDFFFKDPDLTCFAQVKYVKFGHWCTSWLQLYKLIAFRFELQHTALNSSAYTKDIDTLNLLLQNSTHVIQRHFTTSFPRVKPVKVILSKFFYSIKITLQLVGWMISVGITLYLRIWNESKIRIKRIKLN